MPCSKIRHLINRLKALETLYDGDPAVLFEFVFLAEEIDATIATQALGFSRQKYSNQSLPRLRIHFGFTRQQDVTDE